MICPRCQAENRDGVRFCEECGARVELSCPHCGIPVVPGKKFCGACGGGLAPQPTADRFAAPDTYTPKHLAEKILTSKTALEGERKQVTVLFADLKGSMELLADRDPEEARKLLDPVLERMMEAVHRYEGTVNQVMGDGIMALFGAPIAHEDHAVRACYAALRMHETVSWYADELRRAQGIDVQIRVGLNSGEVVVRSIGNDLHMDYTAVGQTTHLAARMEQLARVGATLLTSQALRLVEGFVEVRALGPVPVKGMVDPVEVYEVVRAGPVRSRLQAAAARGLTPFVGRDDELGQLQQALERVRAGHGQVVAIVGEPGVGKSRLFWEFSHSHRAHGLLTLGGGAVSYARLTPYFAVVEVLKGYFQVEDRDDPRRIREKVTGKVLTLDEALRSALPAFLTLLDVPVDDLDWHAPDPATRRQRILDAVKRLLLREARIQPVLLVVENLHWVDSETQAFLDSLVESLPGAPVLLLVNYRPEYQHTWGSRSNYSQLRLDPLTPASAGQLLDSLLGGDASLAPLTALLVRRTEGNPFFLEECVRTLVESEVFAGERGAYRLARPVDSIQMPATVQAVLAARVDRLSPEDKRLLQAAAVVGRHVPFGLLRAVAEVPDDALRQGLTRLQAAEFLYETGLFPDLEYAFTHALTQEVVYGGVLQGRRKGLHRQIVGAIEDLYQERRGEHSEVLAEHAFRGEMWEKAVSYLREAGAKAAARSANHQAVACLDRALSALAQLGEGPEATEHAIDLRLDLRPPLLQLGQLERVLTLSREAEEMARRIGDEPRLARVYTYLVNYHYLKGDPDQAIAYGERCLAIGQARRDVPLQALARGYMGYSYHAQGRYREAQAVLRQNVEMLQAHRAEQGGGPAGVSYVSSAGWLGFTLAELGDFDAATSYATRAQRAADEDGQVYSQAIAGTLAGLVWLRRGHLERAVQLLAPSLEACREKHLTVWQPIPSSLLGLALALLGRPAEGMPLLEDGVRLSEKLGVRAYLAEWTVHLGRGLLTIGDREGAIEVGGLALALAEAHKERGHGAWALLLLGVAAMAGEAPDLGAAERHLGQALAIGGELGMRPLVARARLALGRLHRIANDPAQAEEHLFVALGLAREMDMRYWLDRTVTELKALGHLFVVAHYDLALYEFLRDKFSGDQTVTVILDRRQGDRRWRVEPPHLEQRRSDRRRGDARVKTRGAAVFPGTRSQGAPPAGGGGPEGPAGAAPK